MGKEKSKEVFVLGGKRGWTSIKYTGIYDLDALVSAINGYLRSREYIPVQVEHSEKVAPVGREIIIELTPFRDVTSYVRFSLGIIILGFRTVDVLVEEHNHKVKRQQGDLELLFKAGIVKNWKKTFSPAASGEFFRQTYEKYLVKKKLSGYEDKVEAEAKELIAEVKKVLRSFES